MKTLPLFAGLLLLSTPRPVRTQTVQPPDTLAAAVDRLFDRWRGTGTPGCAVGVSRHGRVLLERGYGMADLEAGTSINPATIFHAASLAKQVTAMSVMLLVREGRLSLDDDVRRFIPELPDYGTRITVRALLTHTSGLRDYIEMLILARGRFEEDRITQGDMMDVVMRQRNLNFIPGHEFLYSNTGYALLALLVSRVGGQSLRDFAAERLFAPLQMLRTSFRDDVTSVMPGLAAGYAPRGTDWRTSTPNYDVYGPTNLLTTVEDLLRWAANYDSVWVGDTLITRQMTTRAVLSNGDSVNYGFGISLVTDRGARVEEHEGADPGYHAYLGRYRDYGLAIAVLCNTRSANAVALGHDIAAIELDTLLHASAPYVLPLAATADTGAMARRAGVYFQPSSGEVVELAWRSGSLWTARRGGDRLRPVGEDRYQIENVPVVLVFDRGPRAGFESHSLLPGHHPEPFEWRAPFVPRTTPRGLAPFAGAYSSGELRSTWHVEARDSTLLLRTGTSAGITVRPVFTDTFISGQLLIEFTRSGSRVSGFTVTHPRARGLRFTRVGHGAEVSR